MSSMRLICKPIPLRSRTAGLHITRRERGQTCVAAPHPRQRLVNFGAEENKKSKEEKSWRKLGINDDLL
jgi:hypothetical protein